jgi:hypothetical protein
MRFIDLTGKQFGRITVLSRITDRKRNRVWKCRCECGTVREIYGGHLSAGSTTSCGECQKHHGSRTTLYHVWHNIKTRCVTGSAKATKDYKGRGIFLCREWYNFGTFRTWAESNGYRVGLSVERVENNAGYSADNCRWIRRGEQNWNKRNTVRVRFREKVRCLGEIATILGIKYVTIYKRYLRGERGAKLFRPTHKLIRGGDLST